MKEAYLLGTALGVSLMGLSIPAPAHAGGVSGSVLVMNRYPTAVDNPGCYAVGISTKDPAMLVSKKPCKTIQYACDLVMKNPAKIGPGVAGTPTGSAGYRLLVASSPGATSTNPDKYVENVKCPASGLIEPDGTFVAFNIIGDGSGTVLHPPVGSTLPALWLTGDNMLYGKIDIQGVAGSKGEGLRVGEPTVRHKNITVYYNSPIWSFYSIGVHVMNMDGYTENNSAVYEAGADGSPCIKIENSTMVHLDTNTVYRCGIQFGFPTTTTNGLEIWNSAGSFVGTMSHPTPPYTAQDLVLNNSPNSTVSNNTQPYKCVVTPATDLPSDFVTPAGNCVGQ